MKKKKITLRSAAQAMPLVAGLINAAAHSDDAQAQLAPAPGTPIDNNSVRTDQATPRPSTVQSATEFHLPPPSMKSVDTTKVPSPYIAPSNHDDYLALEAKMTGDVSQALDTMHLTGDQRIMVREYMGQFDKDNQVMSTSLMNGVQTFAIKNRETGAFVGQVVLRHAEDGAVEVDRVYAAEFEIKRTVDLTVPTNILPEAVKKTLGNSEESHSLSIDAEDSKLEVSVPVIKAKAGIDFGLARQSTAVFNTDGSGKEFVFTTKIASAATEGKVTTQSVSASAGAKGPEVEVAVSYFSKPRVSEEGELTHAVIGGKVAVFGTIGHIQGNAGCDAEKGCGVGGSIGAAGAGGSLELGLSLNKPVEFNPSVPEEHHPSAAEEGAFHLATKDGSPEALEGFAKQYPESKHMDAINLLVEAGAAGIEPGPATEEAAAAQADTEEVPKGTTAAANGESSADQPLGEADTNAAAPAGVSNVGAGEPQAESADIPETVNAANQEQGQNSTTAADVREPGQDNASASNGETQAASIEVDTGTDTTAEDASTQSLSKAPATNPDESAFELPTESADASQTTTQAAASASAAVDETDGSTDIDSTASQEQSAYKAAVTDGSVTALQAFLNEYPNSSHQDEVKKREESASTSTDEPTDNPPNATAAPVAPEEPDPAIGNEDTAKIY